MPIAGAFSTIAGRRGAGRTPPRVEPGARLLICEQILEPDPTRGDPILYVIDTQMMAMLGAARERSEAEFRCLLAETGFIFRRLIPTTSQVFIVESVAALDENSPTNLRRRPRT